MLNHQEEQYLKRLLRENKHQSAILRYLKKTMKGMYEILIGEKSVFILNKSYFQKDSIPKVYAFLINENGKKALTKNRYEKIIAHVDKYNIFINGCTMECSKKENIHDTPIKSILRPTGFALLKEYIENPQPMLLTLNHSKIPSHLKKDEQTALKYFQKARCLVDFREGRYKWKCFKDITGKAENTVFQFVPPAGFKFCLIVPANWE